MTNFKDGDFLLHQDYSLSIYHNNQWHQTKLSCIDKIAVCKILSSYYKRLNVRNNKSDD
jgi:hypothetical protein